MVLGPGIDGFIQAIPSRSLGPGLEGFIQAIPSRSLGPGVEGFIQAIPSRSLGPGVDGIVLALGVFMGIRSKQIAFPLTAPAAHLATVGGCQVLGGAGDPEGVVTAPVGSVWVRNDGAAGSSFYTKTAGVGNVGWQAAAVGPHLTAWLALTDTPGSFAGQAGKQVVVNGGETALEFATAGAAPTGSVTAFAGAVGSIPAGWVPCDGSEYSEIAQAALFAVIGAFYNTGGETPGFFRVPDTRGRSLAMVNDVTLPNGANGSFTTRNLADQVGAENHTHTVPSQAGHTHPVTITADGIHQHVVNVAAGLGTDRFNQANPGWDLFNTDGSHTHPGSSTSANAAHDHGGGTGNQSNISPRLYILEIIKL